MYLERTINLSWFATPGPEDLVVVGDVLLVLSSQLLVCWTWPVLVDQGGNALGTRALRPCVVVLSFAWSPEPGLML